MDDGTPCSPPTFNVQGEVDKYGQILSLWTKVDCAMQGRKFAKAVQAFWASTRYGRPCTTGVQEWENPRKARTVAKRAAEHTSNIDDTKKKTCHSKAR